MKTVSKTPEMQSEVLMPGISALRPKNTDCFFEYETEDLFLYIQEPKGSGLPPAQLPLQKQRLLHPSERLQQTPNPEPHLLHMQFPQTAKGVVNFRFRGRCC